MQFEDNTATQQPFKPITITLKLETADDLKYLASAMNLSSASIKKVSDGYLQHVVGGKSVGFSELWRYLDSIIRARGLLH